VLVDAAKQKVSGMPTYQYRCTECGEELEAVQKFSDAPLAECPNCGGPLRKVFNAVGVVFKGTGFYRTDSRKADSTEGDGAKSDSRDVAAKANGKDSAKGSGAVEKAAKPSADTGSSATGSGSLKPPSEKVGASAH
jgi:putative FmdB family regulatory protein